MSDHDRQSHVSSNKQRKGRRRISIHGKPGAGKTTAALSMVEGFSKLLPRLFMDSTALRKTKWEKVNALWVSADTNATEGARARRIEVPEIDMSKLFDDAPKEVLEVLEEVTEDVYNYVDKEKPQLVCIDTASKFDKPIHRFWEDNAPRTKSGARDSFAIWRSMIATHERFHSNMNALSCDVVFLMHSKPRSESESADKKARAQAVAGQLADIRFDFMYEDCANIYRRDCDLILVADKAKDRGRTVAEYALYADEHGGFETKSRYSGLVPDKFPTDLWGMYQQYIES